MVTRASHKVDRSLSSRIITISMAQEAEVVTVVINTVVSAAVVVIIVVENDEWRRRTMK